MSNTFRETITLLERAHRRCLLLIKVELEQRNVRDINNVQALIIYNLGDSLMTVGELTAKGCYHGSNVSYNLKKLVERGYITHMRSPHDGRSFRVKLTAKGQKMRKIVDDVFEGQSNQLMDLAITHTRLADMHATLGDLDRLWAQTAERVSADARSMGGQ